MKSKFKVSTAAALLGLLALGGGAQAQDKPREVLTGGHSVSAPQENRIYVMDSVFMHLTESRVHVYDYTTGKFLGMVPTAFNGHVQLSNDGKKIYTMTTYHERITRGKRSDVVEVWDADKLTFEKEIALPPKRVQGLNYDGLFRQTTDGKFIVLQNASPATSIGIVDVAKGDYVEDVTAAAGCWSVIPQPNRPRSFMTICGDGGLLTINLDENGKVASQSRSKPMFSVKDDPVFIAPALDKDKAYFVSYYGNLYSADFSGDEVKVEGPWSMLDDEDKAGNWVPGGYNLVGLHRASGRMYVFMHPDGKEGTHKFPAAEIWVLDTKTKKRIARIPGRDALSMTIDQQRDLMLTLDGGNVNVYDISQAEPKLLRTIEGAAEASLQVQFHPVGGA